ncbi:pentapeptide repeat-containing protein [Lentzea flaviverrucosa]|uniref:Uncharacterized protein YjbI, contains pentapeptide repeats n=1 Tax=Lentzea flaviverrucosa TaxID=200379 RepID=A0A1H9EYF5_9PSEU|nr:pentapeptide repeat-containing protein [Lentzea flaviverrucosa]RDI35360.1 uncharacterized protein YjbI with pentapeptide repeats [Lentzea flaviverrucosa]SEQ30685.1 Uncharacterized protein YjbI, contains pentapeptide repeats [Lentzea flaviverrucosa]
MSWRVPGPSWHVAAWGLVILVLAVGGALWFTLDWLERAAAVRTDPNAAIGGKDVVIAKLDAVKIALSAVAGGVALFALYLAVRRQMTAERDLRAQLHAQAHTQDDARARRVTELYTKAADQLGSDKAPVRLAGLYALERLGQDNPDQRPTIASLWCAYLRMPYIPPPSTAATSALPSAGVTRPLLRDPCRRIGMRPRDPNAATPGPKVAHAEAVLERDVRLSVQRLLAKHLRPNPDDSSEPHRDYWPEILNLDLTEATLIDLDFSGCTLSAIRMERATFIGDVRFDRATLTGGAMLGGAALAGATFTGRASFIETTFVGGAVFYGVTFTGEAGFYYATFTGGAVFSGATFASNASFSGAMFAIGAGFGGTTFAGDAVFSGATFTSNASFTGATFASRAMFDGATFAGNAMFDGATFESAPFLLRARARLGDSGRQAVRVWPRAWTLDAVDSQVDGDVRWGRLVPVPEVLDESGR